MIDADKFNNASPKQVAKAAFAVLDRLQTFPEHIQLMAVSAAFTLMMERHRENPQDVFTKTKNLMNVENGKHPEFGALSLYLKHEHRRR